MSSMEPIAHIHTDMPQKFGIPRNSLVAPHLHGRIVFEPEFSSNLAVTGLDGFSHIWLLWQFENRVPGGTAGDIAADAAAAPVPDAAADSNAAADADAAAALDMAAASSAAVDAGAPNSATAPGAHRHPAADTWSPTVRPPRLGGSKRMGVFATRSPFRPNPIGLSCVKLDRVELTDAGPIIHVFGADLRDGTPIYDIKPYIPFADCHPDAAAGFVDEVPWHELSVDFPDDLAKQITPGKLDGLVEVLRQDPRRAGSKHEPKRVYRLAYAGQDIGFTVDGDTLHVVEIREGRNW